MTIGPSARPFADAWPAPAAMTQSDIRQAIDSFAEATRRALEAGFQILEVHGAHGYLIHQFFSPLSNGREDEYGDGFEGRIRFLLETIEAVRRVSGRNFAVQYAARRPGDIMTMVADTSRIRATLEWTPQFDDLETIARHALAWEEKLFQERHGEIRRAASA